MLHCFRRITSVLLLGLFSFAVPATLAQAQHETKTYTPPQAQPQCGDRLEGIAELKKRYGEKPIAMGLTARGEVIEVFSSSSGTFTIISTRPDGISCILLNGESWEGNPLQAAGIES